MRGRPSREGKGRGVIGSWERKRCHWLFFTVSKGKRDNGGKQTEMVKVQTAGAGGSGYSGDRSRAGNMTWSAGDERRGGHKHNR